MLSSLKGVERLKVLSINELDLSGNQIVDSKEFERLKGFIALKKIRMEGN